MEGQEQALPEGLANAVRDLTELLRTVAVGDEDEAHTALGEAPRRLDRALREAVRTREHTKDPLTFSSTMRQAIGHNIRVHREAAGWSQNRFAEAMKVAFGQWTRITVAEVEFAYEEGRQAPRRNVTFDELLFVAALFGVPMFTLMLPPDEERIEYEVGEGSTSALSPHALRELMLGLGGKLGEGGVAWKPALQLARDVTERPAPDFHARSR